eukprot:gene10223-11120_t
MMMSTFDDLSEVESSYADTPSSSSSYTEDEAVAMNSADDSLSVDEEEDKMTTNVEDLKELNSNSGNTPFSSMYPEDEAFRLNSVDEASTVSSFDDATQLDFEELDALGREAVDLDPLSPPIEKLSELLLIMVLDETNRVKEFHIEDYPLLEKPFSAE